jgi:NTE family protein
MRLAHWMAPFGASAFSTALEYSWPMQVSNLMSNVISPYAYGPMYRNPLEDLVKQFHYDEVCADHGPRFFVCATRVSNGKIRIFQGDEIGPEALMASACLPTVFQAVEIEDAETGEREAYWDGGYTGNPALFPMFSKDLPADIVVININPLERAGVPKTPQEIHNRVNEISFNSSLLRELRAIEFVQRLMDEGELADGKMSRVLVHMIADDALMAQLSASTKLVPNAGVIATLKEAGRVAADTFLENHRDDINQRSSADLPAMFG